MNELNKLEYILKNTRSIKTFINTLEAYLSMLQVTSNKYEPCIFKEYTKEEAKETFTNYLEYVESIINKIEYFSIQDLNEIKKEYIKDGEILIND